MQTFDTLLDNYRDTLRPHLRWSSSKEKFLGYLEQDFGAWDLEAFSADELVAWAIATKRGKFVRRSMLNTLGGVLTAGRTIWNTPVSPAAPREAITRLTMHGMLPKEAWRDMRVSDEDLEAISENWNSSIPVDVLSALVDTPVRSGELCRLQWTDLDQKNRTIIVRDRKHPTQKHGNDQRIPLLGRTYDVVVRQPHLNERIFPYSQRTMSAAFASAAALAGVRGVRLHDLRHEGISRRFEQGWTIPQVAAVSGHRNWETLKRYTHISAAELHQLDHLTYANSNVRKEGRN